MQTFSRDNNYKHSGGSSNYYDSFNETIFYNYEQEHKIKIICLKLSDHEKRFGFSIIGGSDECLAPEVEDIVAGRFFIFIAFFFLFFFIDITLY